MPSIKIMPKEVRRSVIIFKILFLGFGLTRHILFSEFCIIAKNVEEAIINIKNKLNVCPEKKVSVLKLLRISVICRATLGLINS